MNIEGKFSPNHLFGLYFLIVSFFLVAPVYSVTQSKNDGFCNMSENQFVDYLGGAATGTAITATAAGDSILIIIAQGGVAVVSAPAVASAVTVTAVSGAAAYVSMKAYCNRHNIVDGVLSVHQTSVKQTVEGIKTAIGTYEHSVKLSADGIETVVKSYEIAKQKSGVAAKETRNTVFGTYDQAVDDTKDIFCFWLGGCRN